MPKPSNVLTVRVTPETRQRLNLLAAAAKVSTSEIARALLDNQRGTEGETAFSIARLREEIGTNTAEQYGQVEALIAAQNELAEGFAALQNEVAEALNNLVKAVAKLYEPDRQRVQQQASVASQTAPPPAYIATPTGTGETWQSWITKQEIVAADGGSPAARARRLWREYEAETGMLAPANIRTP